MPLLLLFLSSKGSLIFILLAKDIVYHFRKKEKSFETKTSNGNEQILIKFLVGKIQWVLGYGFNEKQRHKVANSTEVRALRVGKRESVWLRLVSPLLHQEVVVSCWPVLSTALSISFPTTYKYIKNKIKNPGFIPVQEKGKKTPNPPNQGKKAQTFNERISPVK